MLHTHKVAGSNPAGNKQNIFWFRLIRENECPMVTTVAMHIITKHSTADILTQEVNSANKSRFYGVMVSTLDFESSDPSSNLGRSIIFSLLSSLTPSSIN